MHPVPKILRNLDILSSINSFPIRNPRVKSLKSTTVATSVIKIALILKISFDKSRLSSKSILLIMEVRSSPGGNPKFKPDESDGAIALVAMMRKFLVTSD
jgi:hypothetical protein